MLMSHLTFPEVFLKHSPMLLAKENSSLGETRHFKAQVGSPPRQSSTGNAKNSLKTPHKSLGIELNVSGTRTACHPGSRRAEQQVSTALAGTLLHRGGRKLTVRLALCSDSPTHPQLADTLSDFPVGVQIREQEPAQPFISNTWNSISDLHSQGS